MDLHVTRGSAQVEIEAANLLCGETGPQEPPPAPNKNFIYTDTSTSSQWYCLQLEVDLQIRQLLSMHLFVVVNKISHLVQPLMLVAAHPTSLLVQTQLLLDCQPMPTRLLVFIFMVNLVLQDQLLLHQPIHFNWLVVLQVD